jgi:hypothetical protein
MAWAKLISFLNGLISKISQNKPVKPVKFFSSFPDEDERLDERTVFPSDGNWIVTDCGSPPSLQEASSAKGWQKRG